MSCVILALIRFAGSNSCSPTSILLHSLLLQEDMDFSDLQDLPGGPHPHEQQQMGLQQQMGQADVLPPPPQAIDGLPQFPGLPMNAMPHYHVAGAGVPPPAPFHVADTLPGVPAPQPNVYNPTTPVVFASWQTAQVRTVFANTLHALFLHCTHCPSKLNALHLASAAHCCMMYTYPLSLSCLGAMLESKTLWQWKLTFSCIFSPVRTGQDAHAAGGPLLRADTHQV